MKWKYGVILVIEDLNRRLCLSCQFLLTSLGTVFETSLDLIHISLFIWKCRIWGDQGQADLEKSSICLLNCGPTGSETLKNLVLGGIGSITVVDGSKVEEGDLGNNFLGTATCYSTWLCVSETLLGLILFS